MGVDHIVFGHDPGAFGERGRVRLSKNGILVKLNTDMGIAKDGVVGRPFLLHVSTRGKDSAEVLDENAQATPLL